MSPLTHGKFLTTEQTKRLAMMERGDRQKAIEIIAAHLRGAPKAWGSRLGDQNTTTPRAWYARAAEDWA